MYLFYLIYSMSSLCSTAEIHVIFFDLWIPNARFNVIMHFIAKTSKLYDPKSQQIQ